MIGVVVMKARIFFIVLFALILSVVTSGSFAANSLVSIDTNYGPIVVELYDDLAPITVANFLSYVNSGFYDGLVFHRTYNGLIIQGGAFDADLYTVNLYLPFDLTPFYHAPNNPIVLEVDANLSNVRGTIAMARLSEPDTANSQFFINVSNNSLDFDPSESSDGYAVFGKVIGNMFPVDAIAYTYTYPSNYYVYNYFQDLPVVPAIIESASVVHCVTKPDGDLNGDCSVNLLDITFMAERWLDDTTSH